MRFGKRVTGLLLVACLAVGMTPTTTFAEGTNKTIMLGTSGISAYNGDITNADTIYYGVYKTYDSNNTLTGSYNVSWYAIDLNTAVNEQGSSPTWEGAMLSKYLLGTERFSEDTDISYDADKLDCYPCPSDLKKKMDSLCQDLFTSVEKSKIKETDIECSVEKGNGGSYVTYPSKNVIFPLSMNEALKLGNDILKAKQIDTNDGTTWWLRSVYETGSVYSIGKEGNVNNEGIYSDQYYGVRPAFNLDLSSVLFSSAAEGGKDSSGSLSKIESYTGNEWKLTLEDDRKIIKLTENQVVSTTSDGTITVPYTYTDTATADAEKVNQISVMITNKDYTEILYYGALQGTLSASGMNGTGTFTLPDALKDKLLGDGYRIYILAEHVSGEKVTDYASAPVEITSITDVPDTPVTPDTDDSNNSSSNTDTGSTSTETTTTETTTTETVEPTPITITYTVKKDDYMRKIAREHGITLEQLIALNPQVKNPNLIYAGQILVISTTGSTVSTAEITATKTYTVQRGDSLYKIARKNGMTLAELKSLNENLFAQKYIYAGQTVLLK